MRTIYTTVGTSLLVNLDLMSRANSLEDLRWNSPREGIMSTRFENLKNELLGEIQSHVNDATICAEVQSTLKAKEKYGDIEVYLICTDSVLSPLCAMGIMVLLDHHKIPVRFKTNNEFIIEGLTVVGEDAAKDFEEKGVLKFFKLVRRLEALKSEKLRNDLDNELDKIDIHKLTKEELRASRINLTDKYAKIEQQSRSVFNISGGYKGVIPILTIVAQLYACDTIYNFENGERLITVGEMPINFDWTLANLYGKFILEKEHIISSLSSNEKEIVEELARLGMYKLNKEFTIYKQTIIGEIYSEFISSEHPVAENVMGLFMELLVYKYYQRFKNDGVKTIEHSVKLTHLLPSDKLNYAREIDIYEEKEDQKFSIIEVKSYLQIFLMKNEKNANKFLNQVSSQLFQFTISGQFPEEYRLVIYKAQNVSYKTLKNSIMLIENKVNEVSKGKTKFIPLYFAIDYRLTNRNFYANPYQRILTTGITSDFLKPINFK